MVRVVIAVLLFLAVSSDANAQTTTLETVRVTGMRISSTTLCEGDGCRDFSTHPK